MANPMSSVTLIHEGIPALDPMLNRSPGMHISTIIRSLCIRLGHFDPEKFNDDNKVTRFEMGNAFEDAVIHALRARWTKYDPDRYVDIGELEKDDLFGTPDLYDVIDDIIHEMKLTWMSSRRGPGDEKFWKYEVQIKAYCWMIESTTAHLHVAYLNGDYSYKSPGGDPTYRVWKYEFTPSELAENWLMLKTHGAELEEGYK